MTYRREAGSVEAALTDAINLIPAYLLKEVTNKSRSAFEKAMNPEHPHQLSLNDAARIDACIYALHGYYVLRPAFESETSKHLMRMDREQGEYVSYDLRLSEAMSEVGDIAKAYMEGRSPTSRGGSDLSKAELENIDKEIEEAIRALQAMQTQVRADLYRPALKAAQ